MPVHHSSRFFVFILGAMAAMGIFSTSIYLPSMPAIGESLGASQVSVQLTLTAFFLGSAVGQLVLGPVSDRFGRLPVAYGGIALFIVTSFFCAVTTDVVSLQGWRLLQGVGASVGPLIARAVARDLMSGPQLTKTVSTMMMIISVSPAIAPMVGATLQEQFGWHASFYALMAFGLFVGAVVWAGLPETYSKEHSRSLRQSFSNFGTLFSCSGFIAYCLLLGCYFAMVFCFITMSPYVFIKEYGWSVEEYPILSIIMAAGNIVGFSAVRHLSLRMKPSAAIWLGFWIVTLLNGVLLICLLMDQVNGWFMCGYAAILMIGCAFVTANGSSSAMNFFAHIAGSAAALIGAVQIGSGAFGSAVAGIIDDTSWGIFISVMFFSLVGIILWAGLMWYDRQKVA